MCISNNIRYIKRGEGFNINIQFNHHTRFTGVANIYIPVFIATFGLNTLSLIS